MGMWLAVTQTSSRLLPPPVKYKRLPGLPFTLRALVVLQLHPYLPYREVDVIWEIPVSLDLSSVFVKSEVELFNSQSRIELLRSMSKMKSVFLCCLLATLLPCALSATLQVNSDGGDKLSVWLQSRLRRELCVPDSLEDSGEFQQQNEDTDSVTHRHSQSERVKRGCNLLTCSVHDLAHRLNQLRERTNNAPPDKISPHGYGRRRRRSLPQLSAAETGGQGRVKLNRFRPQRRGSPQKWT
ncbi:pro-adrenomedullin isoform X2 [Colossoma macropomum]|uniref:pro-adrenomedullin isoform X2 n=1 Tax=Colossoma macropomum TaxID=42526 RepID=UPI0018649628|nr:pro-adrenomedullin isoform X2 [Colossoma macropomum]